MSLSAKLNQSDLVLNGKIKLKFTKSNNPPILNS